MTRTALGEKFCIDTTKLILGPFLFNIFIRDMFYFLEDYEIANYTDDTTPYSAQRNHPFVIGELEKSSAILLKWLGNNFIKVNKNEDQS